MEEIDESKIEEKCENIFNIAELRITTSEEYGAFYVRFRQAICNNLKKMGFKLKFLNEQVYNQRERETVDEPFPPPLKNL